MTYRVVRVAAPVNPPFMPSAGIRVFADAYP